MQRTRVYASYSELSQKPILTDQLGLKGVGKFPGQRLHMRPAARDLSNSDFI